MHSDHRNAISRQCSPQGRQCPPQVRLGECQPILSLRIRPRLRHGRTSSVACRRHLPHLIEDHSESRGRLRYGSKFYVNITRVGRNRIPTIGIRISRQCPPQARPSEFVFHGSARRRRDHRNASFAATAALTAGAAFRRAFVPSFRLFSSRAQRCGTRRNSAARRAHG